jgi:DNA-binding NarL/FixJ family response regulator
MRILLIDHEPGFCQRVRQIARRAGVAEHVDDVADLAEARARASGNPAGHLIIFSTTMAPRGAIRDFVAACPNLPLIAVGGNDPERMRAALGEGARAYVRRSDADGELANAIQVVATGGIFVPPIVAMRPGGEPLMTVAGPVPAGFFREDAGQQLTPRQREILVMIRQGRSNIEIAEALDLTVGTVKIHITAIFKALGVRNRTQAMVAADWLNLAPTETVGG